MYQKEGKSVFKIGLAQARVKGLGTHSWLLARKDCCSATLSLKIDRGSRQPDECSKRCEKLSATTVAVVAVYGARQFVSQTCRRRCERRPLTRSTDHPHTLPGASGRGTWCPRWCCCLGRLTKSRKGAAAFAGSGYRCGTVTAQSQHSHSTVDSSLQLGSI